MNSEEYKICINSINSLQVAVDELSKEVAFIRRANIMLYEKYLNMSKNKDKGDDY